MPRDAVLTPRLMGAVDRGLLLPSRCPRRPFVRFPTNTSAASFSPSRAPNNIRIPGMEFIGQQRLLLAAYWSSLVPLPRTTARLVSQDTAEKQRGKGRTAPPTPHLFDLCPSVGILFIHAILEASPFSTVSWLHAYPIGVTRAIRGWKLPFPDLCSTRPRPNFCLFLPGCLVYSPCK